jgi:hypothetical protein
MGRLGYGGGGNSVPFIFYLKMFENYILEA